MHAAGSGAFNVTGSAGGSQNAAAGMGSAGSQANQMPSIAEGTEGTTEAGNTDNGENEVRRNSDGGIVFGWKKPGANGRTNSTNNLTQPNAGPARAHSCGDLASLAASLKVRKSKPVCVCVCALLFAEPVRAHS